MRMSEKCRNNNKHNNNSDNPLTSRRTDGGNKTCSFNAASSPTYMHGPLKMGAARVCLSVPSSVSL